MMDMSFESVGDHVTGENVPPLTPGAARDISEDRFMGNDNRLKSPIRVTMQVIDLALLKYEQPDLHNPDNISRNVTMREAFRSGSIKSLLDTSNDGPLFFEAPRYRLILSDGCHMAPAKFYPETRTCDTSKTQRKVLRESINIVQESKLKKGSIISFKPNSHIETGRGIATIFDIKVHGWCNVIGKNSLRPHHWNVLSFSPRNNHHCTVPLNHHDDPLPGPILHLAKVIENTCGYCAISGSAVLAKYLQEIPGCQHCYESAVSRICAKNKSNDVDLFVPLYPEGLAQFYETGEKEAKKGESFVEGYLPKILRKLFENYGLRHTEIEETKIKLSGVEEGGQDYGWMRVFVGLHSKIEFKLATCTGQLIDRQIQILVIDAFPGSKREFSAEPERQSWSDYIVSGFDADIIKGLAHVDKDTKLEKITFSNDSKFSIHSGVFRYTMRPCHSFPQMLKRLKKYKERGFELASFDFDSRVSEKWRNHIFLQFHLKYASGWIEEWEKVCGVYISFDAVKENIVSFLECRTEEVIRRENRNLLRDEVRTELERTGGFDPGHNEMVLAKLEYYWKLSDAEDFGDDKPDHSDFLAAYQVEHPELEVDLEL